MTDNPGPIEAALRADLDGCDPRRPFDGALTALALGLAAELDRAPTAASAKVLDTVLARLNEAAGPPPDREWESFVEKMSTPVRDTPEAADDGTPTIHVL